MGWGSGQTRDGRWVGYAIEATCDEPGCDAEIDRGLGYICGTMHDDTSCGCANYFCEEHLLFGPVGWVCRSCDHSIREVSFCDEHEPRGQFSEFREVATSRADSIESFVYCLECDNHALAPEDDEALLAEGYAATADEDVLLAEMDLPGTLDCLPD